MLVDVAPAEDRAAAAGGHGQACPAGHDQGGLEPPGQHRGDHRQQDREGPSSTMPTTPMRDRPAGLPPDDQHRPDDRSRLRRAGRHGSVGWRAARTAAGPPGAEPDCSPGLVSSGRRPDAVGRRGWDSNPRNGVEPLGRFQGGCTSPLCDLAHVGGHPNRCRRPQPLRRLAGRPRRRSVAARIDEGCGTLAGMQADQPRPARAPPWWKAGRHAGSHRARARRS